MFTPAQRVQNVQAPIIPIIGQLVRETPGTVSLGQGVVYFGPPDSIKDKMDEFLTKPWKHLYQAVHGIPELLEAIQKKLAADNQIQVSDQQRIFVTAGGNLAYSNAIFAIADPGDEIILPVPYYFNHKMANTLAGCKTVGVPTLSNYQLDIDRIADAITPKTIAIITVSPNNPSGVLYPESDLRAINQLCREKGIYHICDEAYEYFTYGDTPHFSPGSIADSESYTISLYSLSKSYGFASWRIGYMVMPDHLFESVRKIQDTQLICPTVISQYVALAAMEAGKAYCQDKRKEIEASRAIFLEALEEVKDICEVPDSEGAFYFLLRLKSEMQAFDLAEKLIREHKVATIPGETFGLEGCYLRTAYGAMRSSDAQVGINRLIGGLQKIMR